MSFWRKVISCHPERSTALGKTEGRVESKDPYLKLVNHFLRLFIHLNGERLKRRRIHRHGNPLHSRGRGRKAIPPSLFRNEVHKKHLSIDFESQFAFLFLARKG